MEFIDFLSFVRAIVPEVRTGEIKRELEHYEVDVNIGHLLLSR
jgi:hypothetical protein